MGKFFNVGLFVLLLFLVGFFTKNEMLSLNSPLFSKIVEFNLSTPDYNSNHSTKYDIDASSFKIVENKVKRNQTLSTILAKHNIDYAVIDELAKKSEKVFDVRKIAAGKSYTVFCSKDSLSKARYLIYEPNDYEYVVFDLNDRINIYKKEKQIEVRRRVASGIISSSLYNTLTDNDINPLLATKLSEVFAWQIDFYRLHKNDRFKVIYDEKFVDGKSIGVGEIHAALFEHQNTDYYAFTFEYDSKKGYYDENGESLRKAFLSAPLEYTRISSRYTKKRYHPVLKRNKAHLGTDYAAPRGTPIRSVGDGKVIAATYKKYNGNYVKIKHNGTYTTQYLHMSKIANSIKRGKHVKQGQVIGYVGSTGLATGPHLCYRFWKNGRQVDPYREKLPASPPLEAKYMKAFNQVKDQYLNELQSIGYNGKSILANKYGPPLYYIPN